MGRSGSGGRRAEEGRREGRTLPSPVASCEGVQAGRGDGWEAEGGGPTETSHYYLLLARSVKCVRGWFLNGVLAAMQVRRESHSDSQSYIIHHRNAATTLSHGWLVPGPEL